nr:unnamed protein product [Callosobruchus analis]
MKYPKGKGLGGTTIINFMIYTRGNKIDYDKWEAMGNPGWSYEDVLPYFIKAEDAQLAFQDNEYHGQGGYMKVLAQLMRPRSVGYMRLRSVNPFDEPRYFTNFLSDPENKDIRAHVAAIREVQRIVSQPALQRYGPKIVDTPIPGCAKFTFDTDEYWECAVRELTSSFWHQQATCKMGPKDDKEAVVDARLRLHGINKLRVVDTGVIPRSITAHLAGPAYMIGEKGADIIKQDWGEIPESKTPSESPSKHSDSNLEPEAKLRSEPLLEQELRLESQLNPESPELKSESESHAETESGIRELKMNSSYSQK